MDDLQAETSAAPSAATSGGAAAGVDPEAQDPRPVFAGEWAKASGAERQAHMVLVNAWRARQKAKGAEAGIAAGIASSKAVAPSPVTQGAAAMPAAAELQTAVTVLTGILNDPDALDTSRVAAARELRALLQGQGETAPQASELSELRAVVRELPPEERAAFLRDALHVTELQEGDAPVPGVSG